MATNLAYRPTPDFDAWLAEHGPADVTAEIAELDRAYAEGLTERLLDAYDQKTEVTIWKETKRRSEQRRRFGFFSDWPNRPALSFHLQVKMLSRILRADTACRHVVDFGALYAKPDADIARAFPDVTVYGVDRSELVKGMNIGAFPDVDNLHFVAGDICEFLRGHNDLRGGMLVHALTGICMLPKAMDNLYWQCAASGIRHIVAIELVGYSHQLRGFYKFGGNPQRSAVFRESMLLHDYPNLLEAAGYSIVSATLLPCPMPKPRQRDAHLIVVHAIARS